MFRIVAAFLLAMLLPVSAAAALGGFALSDAQRRDVHRIQSYLNDLTTLDSRFVQISEQGVAEGRVLLSRPGRIRIDYSPPVPVLMVASGSWLMYHDRDLQQTSYLPVEETPVAFLLSDAVDISGGLTVTGFERAASTIRLTLVEADTPDAGSVTLTFEDAPLRLAQWRVIDAQGNQVDFALLDPKFGVPVDQDLFSTIDPLIRPPGAEGR